MELAKVDCVHNVAGGNLLDGMKQIGVDVCCRLLAVHIAAEVGKRIGLRRLELRHLAVLAAEVRAAVIVSVIEGIQ